MFKQTHRLCPRAFSRKRKLDFPTLLLYLLNLRKASTQIELDAFFSAQQGDPFAGVRTVTKSALIQARQQLAWTAFRDLNHRGVTLFYEQAKEIRTWHGFRLCAVDGSQIVLPQTPDVIATFGEHVGKAGRASRAMGLASVCYDPLNKVVVDAMLEPAGTPELSCARAHLEHVQAGDLMLYDRNYNAFWFYALHRQRQLAFCARGKIKRDPFLAKFVASGTEQAQILLQPSAGARRLCRRYGVPSDALKLRLIRVDLPGEVEVLITNLLDEKRYNVSVFKELYHLRWGVEEGYKRIKQWVEIENFSGRSALSVRQDFHAQILSLNLTAWAMIAAQQQVDTRTQTHRYRYQVNFVHALSKMKHRLVLLIRRAGEDIVQLILETVQCIAVAAEPVRTGRSYPRKMPSQRNRRHYQNYKRAL